MDDFILSHEVWIRGGCFAAVLIIMAILEIVTPARPRNVSRLKRWTRNLAITRLGAVTVRLVIPLLAVGVAFWAESARFGLFNHLDWPRGLEIALAVVVLDLLIYVQHVVMHRIPLLWRLHRTHHADAELDVTTGGRFHPFEIWLSMGVKMAAVAALGAAPVAVVLFEVILSSMALFNHSNVRLPEGLDRVLRFAIVTPAMHRVHHSPVRDETNSNYGFNLSVWDRLFSTYRQAVRNPGAAFGVGLLTHRDVARRTFVALMVDPFKTMQDDFNAGAKRIA